jgi:hypothetical protein
MSSLSIAASVATASLRQIPANTIANTPGQPPRNANPPSSAGAPAGTGGAATPPLSAFSTSTVTQPRPTAPPANTNAPATPSPNANPASQTAQQIATGNAANSKAIQAGSNRIGSFLDINV